MRRGGAQLVGLELQAVGAVVDPLAAGLDVLAGDDARQGADDGDQVAVLRSPDLEDDVPVVQVVERDPLDHAGDGFGARAHGSRSSITPPSDMPATRTAFLAAVGLAGLLLTFHPTIFSGFDRMQPEAGDVLLNNSSSNTPTAGRSTRDYPYSFWSPGFYYPTPYTFTYSETLIGTAPLYWLLRVVVLRDGRLPALDHDHATRSTSRRWRWCCAGSG